MSETRHVVLHTAPDGRALPTGASAGQLLVFLDAANAESFARGLVEAGLPEAVLAAVGDLDAGGAAAGAADGVTVFEDGVSDLSVGERLDRAHRLALELGPTLLQRY
jgi:hypothetical protein